MRLRHATRTALVLLVALAAGARAQMRIPTLPTARPAPTEAAPELAPEPSEENLSDRSRAELDALAREHDRVQLHPGDALALSGREQEGNDLRSRTSALVRNHAGPVHVDAESLYVRLRAIYDNRAVFHRALPAVGGPPVLRVEPDPAPVAPALDELPQVPSVTWPLIPIGVILALFASVLVARSRRSEARPAATSRTIVHLPD